MGVGELEKIKGVARKVQPITSGRDRDKRQPGDTDSRRIQLGGQTPREEGLLGPAVMDETFPNCQTEAGQRPSPLWGQAVRA